MKTKQFATAINCIDGRTQIPLIEFLKRKYKIDYVDMITEPGPNKILAEGKNKLTIKSIYKKIEISVTKHNSKIVAIAGHYDCAGNPVDKEKQIAQLRAAAKVIEKMGFCVKVIGLWIDKNWKVSEIV